MWERTRPSRRPALKCGLCPIPGSAGRLRRHSTEGRLQRGLEVDRVGCSAAVRAGRPRSQGETHGIVVRTG
jgi:hypothetical protein